MSCERCENKVNLKTRTYTMPNMGTKLTLCRGCETELILRLGMAITEVQSSGEKHEVDAIILAALGFIDNLGLTFKKKEV